MTLQRKLEEADNLIANYKLKDELLSKFWAEPSNTVGRTNAWKNYKEQRQKTIQMQKAYDGPQPRL